MRRRFGESEISVKMDLLHLCGGRAAARDYATKFSKFCNIYALSALQILWAGKIANATALSYHC